MNRTADTAAPLPAPDSSTSRAIAAAQAFDGIVGILVLRPRRRLGPRLVERALDGVVHVGRNRMIAPQPAHHLRQDGAALPLAVPADAPRIVQVVAFVA